MRRMDFEVLILTDGRNPGLVRLELDAVSRCAGVRLALLDGVSGRREGEEDERGDDDATVTARQRRRKRQRHELLLRALFRGGDKSVVASILRRCVLVREAFVPLCGPSPGFDALLEDVTKMDATKAAGAEVKGRAETTVTIRLVGRKAKRKRDDQMEERVRAKWKFGEGSVAVLADLRGVSGVDGGGGRGGAGGAGGSSGGAPLFFLASPLACGASSSIRRGKIRASAKAAARSLHGSTTMLDPTRALLAVNAAAAFPGSLILDPFCGAGAIEDAASVVGAVAVGSDVDRSAVGRIAIASNSKLKKYCKEVVLADARATPWRQRATFDAIACDPPYGRRATQHAESAREILAALLSFSRSALCRGGRLAFWWGGVGEEQERQALLSLLCELDKGDDEHATSANGKGNVRERLKLVGMAEDTRGMEGSEWQRFLFVLELEGGDKDEEKEKAEKAEVQAVALPPLRFPRGRGRDSEKNGGEAAATASVSPRIATAREALFKAAWRGDVSGAKTAIEKLRGDASCSGKASASAPELAATRAIRSRALCLASGYGKAGVVRELLSDFGARGETWLLDTSSPSSSTAASADASALHRASRFGHVECVKLLLASLEEERESEKTEEERYSGETTARARLSVALRSANNEGHTAVALATMFGHLDTLGALLDAWDEGKDKEPASGLLLEACGPQGQTALHHACRWGMTGAAKMLIERTLGRGGVFSAQTRLLLLQETETKETALSLAARFGHRETANAMLAELKRAEVAKAISAAELARAHDEARKAAERWGRGKDFMGSLDVLNVCR